MLLRSKQPSELLRWLFGTIWRDEVIVKGGMAVRTAEEIESARRFITRFSERLAFTWTTTPALPEMRFINIIDKNASKGRALRALCKHLAIPMEQVCAIGDGANDISLLSEVGLAIAMQNAPAELKAVADKITEDVANNGVAKAIQSYLL